MTKREEFILQLTKEMSLRDKHKLIAFWRGKGSIDGSFYEKYKDKIEELDRLMQHDNVMEDYLKDIASNYKRSWKIEALKNQKGDL